MRSSSDLTLKNILEVIVGVKENENSDLKKVTDTED